MNIASLIIENKYILEAFYSLVIVIACMIISLKADKFFRLSSHQGIRYFRNAFIFYGTAFASRYLIGFFEDHFLPLIDITRIFFEYTIIMAGFFLVYSLVWKKFEIANEESSVINKRIIVLHLIAFAFALLDFFSRNYYVMFFSQIAIFLGGIFISYANSKKAQKKQIFQKFYFIAMILSFSAWMLNFIAASYLEWNKGLLINIGLINIIFFLLFLCGIIKVTKR